MIFRDVALKLEFVPKMDKKHFGKVFNPIPDEKILDWSKLKAFADDKSNVTQNIKFVFHRVGNIVGKKENAGNQHFFLFPQWF